MKKNKLVLIGAGLLVLLAIVVVANQKSSSRNEPGKLLSAEEKQGKKIYVYRRANSFRNLDPVKQFDEASADIVKNIYSTLLQYKYLVRPYELGPELALQMPELSADKMEYTFTLRQDARFVDDACFPSGQGRVVTADDVIYSLKRFADANVNVQSYTLMQGFIAGMDEFREQTRKLGSKTDYDRLQIAGLTKVDDFKFKMRLTRPNPLALYPLAASQLAIVPKEAVQHYGVEFERHPVGSGPFYIKDLARRGVMILAKNPHYFETYPREGSAEDEASGHLVAAGTKLPLIDEVHMPLIEESQPAMLSFLKGEIDLVDVDKDNFVKMAYRDTDGTFKLKDDYKDKFAIYYEPGTSTELYKFNMKDKVVGGYDNKHKALRQAIAYALDVPAYLELLRNGRGLPSKTIVPHSIAGSETDNPPQQFFSHNLEMAKKKLIEAGYPEGRGLPPIVFEYRASTIQTRQDFEFERAQLAKVGIKAEANFQTFSAWLQKTEMGNYQVSSAGWQADFPDAENFYQLMYSRNLPPGPNDGSYKNAAYDKLYEQIRFMPNGPERYALFQQMNDILFEDVPAIFTWNAMRVGLYQRWVKNFRRNMLHNPPLRYIDIDLATKGEGL